jgi:hypothetical protein
VAHRGRGVPRDDGIHQLEHLRLLRRAHDHIHIMTADFHTRFHEQQHLLQFGEGALGDAVDQRLQVLGVFGAKLLACRLRFGDQSAGERRARERGELDHQPVLLDGFGERVPRSFRAFALVGGRGQQHQTRKRRNLLHQPRQRLQLVGAVAVGVREYHQPPLGFHRYRLHDCAYCRCGRFAGVQHRFVDAARFHLQRAAQLREKLALQHGLLSFQQVDRRWRAPVARFQLAISFDRHKPAAIPK